MDINKRLKEAAMNGDAEEMEKIMQEPGCDPLFTHAKGMTSLMWAAHTGEEACVKLLLPVSESSAQDDSGRTASEWAKFKQHDSISKSIDAYVLAQSERAAIEGASVYPSTRGQATRRV